MRTIVEVRRWASSIKGDPKIRIIEYLGGIEILTHRQHRRCFRIDRLRLLFPMGLYLKLRFAPHSEFKYHFHIDSTPLIEGKYHPDYKGGK